MLKTLLKLAGVALVLVAIIAGSPLPALASQIMEFINLEGKRPAGMYTSVQKFNPGVCQVALDSLNREFSISDDRLDNYPSVAVDSDLLLSSHLQLPWTRRLVRQPDAELFHLGSVDFASATLGGQLVAVYRRTFEIHGERIGRLPVNGLMISNEPLTAIPDNQTLQEGYLERIHGTDVLIDAKKLKNADDTSNLSLPRAQQSSQPQRFLLNVITIAGQVFILAVDAVQAEIDGAKSGSQTDLHLLQLHSATDIRLVCRFVGY